MSRSRWKGPFIDHKLFKDRKKNYEKSQNTIKTVFRSSEIIPKFIGISFNIYNGKNFSKTEITEEMIGFKLGEFSPTRKKFSFKKKK